MFRRLMSDTNWIGRLMAASTVGVIALGTVAATATAQDTSSDTVRPASIHTGSCDAPGDVVAELKNLVVMFDDDDDGNASNSGGGGAAPQSTPGSGGDDSRGGDGDDDADDNGNDDDADDNGNVGSQLAFQTGGGFVGPDDASVVEGSEDSDVGTTLDALLAEPHVIAVFESEGSDTVIACGSIGGYLRDDDDDDDDDLELAVGLREQNASGFAGVALLNNDDDDDDNDLDADVYISRDVAGDA